MIDDHVRSKNIGQIIHLNKRQTMTPIHTVEYGSEGKKTESDYNESRKVF